LLHSGIGCRIWSDWVSRFVNPHEECAMGKMLNIVPEKCTGCMQCELACSWVQTGTFAPSRSVIRVNVFDEEASYAPLTCLQCDEAWCMTACPVNAIGVDERTGAKVVIESLCIGCHLCTIACPFGTVFTLPHSDKASKCNLCGGRPACAMACPTAAIEFVEMPEPGAWFAGWGDRVNRGYLEAMTPSG
jgi:anaerobic carbon-monoxide dehydrogenase iron sulfur subunit